MAEVVNGVNGNVKNTGMPGRIVGWGIGRVINIILLLGMIASLMPRLNFSWRVNQPMELTEFGGKTLYQVLEERQRT
jgi:hypothetical protein